MATTRDELRRWFDEGVAKGATHMVVKCDTYDHEDYPDYATSEEHARAMVANPGQMQRIMEVYNLKQDRETQISQVRVMNF
jgi:hypothetical protein